MRRALSLVAAFILAITGLVLPHRTFAANNDVQLTADVTLQANGVSIIALSGANVASLATDGTTITIGLESGSTLTLRSDDKRALTASPEIATYTCESSSSQIVFSSSSTQTITVSISSVSGCASTSSSSSTSSSGGGGGGGGGAPPVAPTGAAVQINGDAATTANLAVTLTLSATNATQVLVGNSTAFTDLTSWVPMAATMAWTLPAGAGEKTVYAKFRSSSGAESAVVKDTITVLAGAVAEPKPTPVVVVPSIPVLSAPPVSVPAKTVAPGTLVKEAGKSAVYLIENGKRRVFRNGDIFLSHGYQWKDVATVKKLTAFVGDPVDYPVVNGLLVKGSGAKVYLVVSGKRRWITTEKVFVGLGYPWSSIRVIFDSTLNGMVEGEPISSAYGHVDGTLIKYTGNPKIYVVEGGKRRWIPSEDVFRRRGYRWENILVIPDTFAYTDGADLTAEAPAAPSVPTPGQVLGVATPTFVSTLSLGSAGDEVLALQQLLAEHGFFPSDVVPNGRFGPTTVASVKRFQAVQGISAIGTVGPKTRDALNQLAGNP